jgi:hypothetical protein
VQALETLRRPVLLLAVTTGLGFRTAHVALYATPKKTARDDAKEITVPRRSMKGCRVPHANPMPDVAKASQLRKHGTGDDFPLNFYPPFLYHYEGYLGPFVSIWDNRETRFLGDLPLEST